MIRSALVADADAAWATSDTVSAENGIVTVEVPANTSISYELKIGWSWAYSSGHDAEDTLLSYLASDTYPETYRYGTTTYTLRDFTQSVTEISFALTASVVQSQ